MSFIFKPRTISVLEEVVRQTAEYGSSGDKNPDSDNPRFHLPLQNFRPGWYFIEIRLASSQTFTDAVFTVEYKNHIEEVFLPLKAGRTAKRLLWIRHRPESIPFNLGEKIVEFSTTAFKFDKTLPIVARSRMKINLYNRNLKDFKTPEELWDAYNRIFIPGQIESRYEYWINKVENKTALSIKDKTQAAFIGSCIS